jgi:hypothetical protein
MPARPARNMRDIEDRGLFFMAAVTQLANNTPSGPVH